MTHITDKPKGCWFQVWLDPRELNNVLSSYKLHFQRLFPQCGKVAQVVLPQVKEPCFPMVLAKV